MFVLTQENWNKTVKAQEITHSDSTTHEKANDKAGCTVGNLQISTLRNFTTAVDCQDTFPINTLIQFRAVPRALTHPFNRNSVLLFCNVWHF